MTAVAGQVDVSAVGIEDVIALAGDEVAIAITPEAAIAGGEDRAIGRLDLEEALLGARSSSLPVGCSVPWVKSVEKSARN